MENRSQLQAKDRCPLTAQRPLLDWFDRRTVPLSAVLSPAVPRWWPFMLQCGISEKGHQETSWQCSKQATCFLGSAPLHAVK